MTYQDVQERIGKFSREMATGEMLIRVMRAQLYLERQLLTIIEKSVKAPEQLPERLEYSTKLKWCLAFGLDTQLRQPLACIGKFRNDYAHFALYELTKDQLTKACQSFDAPFIGLMKETLTSMLAKDAPAMTLKDLPAEDTFSLLALCAWTELLKETSRLTGVSMGEVILTPFPPVKR